MQAFLIPINFFSHLKSTFTFKLGKPLLLVNGIHLQCKIPVMVMLKLSWQIPHTASPIKFFISLRKKVRKGKRIGFNA